MKLIVYYICKREHHAYLSKRNAAEWTMICIQWVLQIFILIKTGGIRSYVCLKSIEQPKRSRQRLKKEYLRTDLIELAG